MSRSLSLHLRARVFFLVPFASVVAIAACSGSDASVGASNDDGGLATDDGAVASDTSPTTDASDTDGSAPATCPGSGDPSACDDGTGATVCPLSKVTGATASYHVQVSGSKFATSGACVYVTPSSCASAAGDVAVFSGSGGTDLSNIQSATEASPYCFRVFDVAWDTDWEDDGKTTGGPAGAGGDFLAASLKPRALLEWLHDHERSSATTPFCARGSSGGSSLLLYQLMHDDGEAILDHVQIISATPFGRIDKGCDSTSPQEGSNVVCSTLPPTTEPEYNSAADLIRTNAHDPNCDRLDGGGLSDSERASFRAMSLVPEGFTPITLQHTSLSAYMCSMAPNATQGQAVDVFGVNADLASDGGAYTGVISLSLGTSFYGCAAGSTCAPHVECSTACATEDFGGSPGDQTILLDDMKASCVLRH